MTLRTLELVDFRCFVEARLEPEPEGTTVLVGPNGTGKTTFLEAASYLGTRRSFRGAPREALVRDGQEVAIVRADLERAGQSVLIETEVVTTRRARTQLNRQPVRDPGVLARAAPATVFSPEDLALIQGPPAHRRGLLDDALAVLDGEAECALADLERAVRQRTALLRQCAGRLDAASEASLDVWDERLAQSGTVVSQARAELVRSLEPRAAEAYRALAGEAPDPTGVVRLTYRPSWEGTLADALPRARREDVRRGVTTVGPHRDDLVVALGGRDARLRASQGEQRSLALALRLAVHDALTEHDGTPPLLLLDDVFSELDPARGRALTGRLPAGQALLTTASPLPDGVAVARVLRASELGRRRPIGDGTA